MDIRIATSAEDYELARELFREYVLTPGVAVCAVGFEDELRALETFYDAILLAQEGDRAVGCGAVRTIEPGVCEIKRIYVKPEARGLGAGLALTVALLEQAGRRPGVRAVRLDTLPSMRAAIGLYESLGFQRIPAYSAANPADALCFELTIA
ncbi:MAG TPA: GNAT family N-acetyltransferase [Paludibaculum sp.]|jgi:ribosomal protein S18 acetylase RimI-like enzyme